VHCRATQLLLGALLASCGGGDVGDPLHMDRMQAQVSMTAGTGTFGSNLLIDPSFEEALTLGSLPTAPGSWRGDLGASMSAEWDIAPHDGAAMLKFQATGATASANTLTSKQWQLVDLSRFAEAIAAGGVRADASGWFNRVDGGASTDRRFDLRVIAFDGSAADLPARYAANSWLAEDTAPLISAANRWQQVSASLVLPPGTTYVLIELCASEDVFNDGASPEFTGHYADDLALVLVQVP